MDAASRKEKEDERMWLEDKEKGKRRRKRMNILLKTYKKERRRERRFNGQMLKWGKSRRGKGDVPRTEEAKERTETDNRDGRGTGKKRTANWEKAD